MVATNSKIL